MAASPNVAPTVRCSITLTGTGSAPPLIRIARSLADCWVNCPVIWVALPAPEHSSGCTAGEEIALRSRRMAIRWLPSGVVQARLTRSRHCGAPERLKVTDTTQDPTPPSGSSARASWTPLPSRTRGPIRMGKPSSSSTCVAPPDLRESGCPGPCTTWNPSCAVRPITRAASLGSCTPGSSMMMRRSPARARVGSATPRASTRPRRTSSARSVDPRSAVTRSLSCVSRTIWVPPSRSRPSRGDREKAASRASPSTTNDATARRSGAPARRRERLVGGVAGMWTPLICWPRSCRLRRSHDAGGQVWKCRAGAVGGGMVPCARYAPVRAP